MVTQVKAETGVDGASHLRRGVMRGGPGGPRLQDRRYPAHRAARRSAGGRGQAISWHLQAIGGQSRARAGIRRIGDSISVATGEHPTPDWGVETTSSASCVGAPSRRCSSTTAITSLPARRPGITPRSFSASSRSIRSSRLGFAQVRGVHSGLAGRRFVARGRPGNARAVASAVAAELELLDAGVRLFLTLNRSTPGAGVMALGVGMRPAEQARATRRSRRASFTRGSAT